MRMGVNVHLTAPENGGCQAKKSIQTSLNLKARKSYVSYKAQYSYKPLNKKYLGTHLFLIYCRPSRMLVLPEETRLLVVWGVMSAPNCDSV